MKIKTWIYFNLIAFSTFCQQSEEVFRDGVKELDLGNYAIADSLFTKAIIYDKAYNKFDYVKFYNRGLARKYMDSIPKAISDFDKSISLNKTFFLSFQERSVCYYMYGKDSLALLDINKSIELKPTDIESYIVRILINLDSKNYKAVVSDCSKALIIEKDPRFYGFRAMANTFLNHLDQAKKDVEAGNKIFPMNVHILEAEIFYLYKKNLDYCDKVKKIKKLDPDFEYSISDTNFLSEIKKCW